ncbi:Homeodomain-like protein [Mycena vitilis]|nr:Homeodomain-like protein [Mycena vitilis]
MNNRERRQWTSREDELLRMAVNLGKHPGSLVPSKWNAIAQHVPNRTNKDCRKRWHAKMRSTDVVNGGWKPTEDQRLFNAVERYGTRLVPNHPLIPPPFTMSRWSVVAPLVKTRNSDQCAKRWWDTLNPAIDRTAWTAEADETLIQAVNEHGKVWTQIAQMYFPGRTGLAAKNRSVFLHYQVVAPH